MSKHNSIFSHYEPSLYVAEAEIEKIVEVLHLVSWGNLATVAGIIATDRTKTGVRKSRTFANWRQTRAYREGGSVAA